MKVFADFGGNNYTEFPKFFLRSGPLSGPIRTIFLSISARGLKLAELTFQVMAKES